MPRNTLTFKDIFPRVFIGCIWIAITCVMLWDCSKDIMDEKYQNRGIIFTAIYLFVSIIWLWAYYSACWSDPGSIEAFYKKLGVYDDILNGNTPEILTLLPVCQKCHLPKPERTHHCSRCGLCYFKFDHHCPVIGNCVAFNNFKGFFFMPIYGTILLIILGVELGMHHGWVLIIIPCPFAFLFLLFSLSYCSQICDNLTTLEKETLKCEPPFQQSKCQNFTEVFDGFFGLFLPTPPKISGFHWSGEQIENGVYELQKMMKSKDRKKESTKNSTRSSKISNQKDPSDHDQSSSKDLDSEP
ncbi:DHHC zinc finger domain containing protein [Tritrichomonas foetus]|uniref:Palmitoyltransferase n=1 Tax=Tritrichomonas foetus TaxID=1144522 RepID=A0A1J4KG33_9EUKA|nr:DHHC zinc finger domain containing protein [Tritrichomonas foetus]|eukprot:OHT08309.1 DHHC zinc finger domain containing protein [Tritrichomonas foetus]